LQTWVTARILTDFHESEPAYLALKKMQLESDLKPFLLALYRAKQSGKTEVFRDLQRKFFLFYKGLTQFFDVSNSKDIDSHDWSLSLNHVCLKNSRMLRWTNWARELQDWAKILAYTNESYFKFSSSQPESGYNLADQNWRDVVLQGAYDIDIAKDRQALQEAWSKGKDSNGHELDALVKNLHPQDLEIVGYIDNLLFAKDTISSLTSVEKAQRASDILELFQKHHPEVLNRSLGVEIMWRFSALATCPESMAVIEKLAERTLGNMQRLDLYRISDGLTLPQTVIQKSHGNDYFPENLLKILLVEMKKKYLPHEMILILNKENNMGKTALNFALGAFPHLLMPNAHIIAENFLQNGAHDKLSEVLLESLDRKNPEIWSSHLEQIKANRKQGELLFTNN